LGGSSGGGELSPGGGSAEMISDGRTNANGKVLVKGVDQNLLPTAQAWRRWRPCLPVATPGTGNSHIDLFGHLTPRQALIMQFHDLLCGCRMCGSATAHSDLGTA
jgi:hypothetical protein